MVVMVGGGVDVGGNGVVVVVYMVLMLMSVLVFVVLKLNHITPPRQHAACPG